MGIGFQPDYAGATLQNLPHVLVPVPRYDAPYLRCIRRHDGRHLGSNRGGHTCQDDPQKEQTSEERSAYWHYSA
jgi:hypothetical protein